MSRWTKLKIIIGAIVSIFVILSIILLINIGHFVNSKYEQPSTNQQKTKEEQTLNKKLNMDNDFAQIVTNTAKRNSDWANLPLSKSFRKKYNNEVGILGKDDDYTNLYGSSFMSNKEEQLVVLYVDNNYKQEEYYIHYTLNENNELDDVEIVDKKLLYDENGNEVIYKESISEENYEDILIKLADPYNINHAEPETNYYNLTENYMSNWSGGFVNSRGFDYYSRYIIKELSNFKDRIAYMKCEYPKFDNNGDIIDIDEGLTLYYKIKFYINNNMWLDDVEVEEVSKEEIDRLLSEKEKESNP